MSTNSASDIESQPEDNDSFIDFSEDDQTPIICVFCQFQSCNAQELFKHMSCDHGFAFHNLRSELKLEFLQCIALFNYLRSKYSSSASTKMDVSGLDWSLILEEINGDLERWLVPVLEHDRLLYEFDNANEDEDDLSEKEGQDEKFNDFELQELRRRNAELTSLLQRLTVGSSEPSSTQPSLAMPEKEELDYYFSGYSDISIHETMLKDRIRTDAYRDFIYMNKSLFAGKIVMDVGCGTGILSLFASRAGAKKVYAIDNSHMIDLAKQIASNNGVSNIEFIRGKVEDIQLPEQVDLIISEWMGYALLFEGMLDTVLHARDKFLRPECKQNVFPNKCDIYVAGVEDCEYQMEKFNFWDNVYGFDMSCIPAKFYKKQAIVDLLSDPRGSTERDANGQLIECQDDEILITNQVMLNSIDCTTVTVKQLDFERPFAFECTRDGKMYAICLWFDSIFDGISHRVEMSTSPLRTATHWKQTILQLRDPIECQKGQQINGQISLRKSPDNPRDLEISVHIPEMNMFEEYALKA